MYCHMGHRHSTTNSHTPIVKTCVLQKRYNPCDYLFHIQMSYQVLLSWKLDAEVRCSHPCTGPWFAMQIASIPQKALSPLLSRRGKSNRYPVRPAKKIRGGGNPVHVESAVTTRELRRDCFGLWREELVLAKRCQVVRTYPACAWGKTLPMNVSQGFRSAG